MSDISVTSGSETQTARSKIYLGPLTASGVQSYGDITTRTAGTRVTESTFTANPPTDDKSIALTAAGQSFTMTVGGSTSTRVNGGAASVTTSSVAQTKTFVGRETVTMPAGTFVNACKFEVRTGPSANPTSITTTWVTASGQGLTVKVQSVSGSEPTTIAELTSGSADGVPAK